MIRLIGSRLYQMCQVFWCSVGAEMTLFRNNIEAFKPIFAILLRPLALLVNFSQTVFAQSTQS